LRGTELKKIQVGKTPHFIRPAFVLTLWHEATAISLLHMGDRAATAAALSEPVRNPDRLGRGSGHHR